MSMSRALVRLISLLVVAVGLIGLAPLSLALLAGILALWIGLLERGLTGLLAQRIWRMRWFFLAIAILYGLGSPLADPWLGWQEGAYRVAVLIVLVVTVGLCLNQLPARELSDGIASLLRPLKIAGLPVEVFARRTAATLDAVNEMSERVRSLPRGRSALNAVAQICEQAERYQANAQPDHAAAAPTARDWAFFVLMVVSVGVLQWLT